MFLLANKYEKLLKLLELDKPLVIFDATTTGASISNDKIIHLSYEKIWTDGRVKKDDFLLNPEFAIPPESTSIHGIRTKHVKDKPTFREKSQEIWDIFCDCYYAGFNIMDFDLPVLRREFVRVGMDFEYKESQIIDTKTIFHYLAPRTIALAYDYYIGKEPKHSYDAVKHTEMAGDVLIRQLEKYKEARDKDFLTMIHKTDESARIGSTRKFYWVNGEAYFAFSKYRNQAVSSIVKKDREFLEWILEADFREDAKNIVKQALENGKKK